MARAPEEPSVEDFQSKLGFASDDNPLPGLNSDGPVAPTYKLRNPQHMSIEPPQVSYSRRSMEDDDLSSPNSPDLRQDGSSMAFSDNSTAASEPTLAPLQVHGLEDEAADKMETIVVDDPRNFDLLAPPSGEAKGVYQLEARSDQLFSNGHLNQIFTDPKLLLHFTGFLHSHRPRSLRVLAHYLDTVKAIRAVRYANAVTDALSPLDGHDFSNTAPPPTTNAALEDRARQAFKILVDQELPAYIAYTWIQVVSESVTRRVTGTLAPHLREMSEGLAEVFCLSDPSRPDNPIVFASEEFQRTTQYGMGYCVGRNCRFLQGPRTNRLSVKRLAEACRLGKEHSEVFLNYRRDGQPFMNLLMMAPLHDTQGNVRYFIGAQVDVSGLVKDCTDLEGFRRQVAREADAEVAAEQDAALRKDEFQSLSEMFNNFELEAVRKHGGSMHREQVDDDDDTRSVLMTHRPRLLLSDATSDNLDRQSKENALNREAAAALKAEVRGSGRLQGVYQHYLLVRPAPSMRILFTSPSLRIPGILQSPFLDRVGGSSRIRHELTQAFVEGRGVTAKIRWLTRPRADEDEASSEGRARWIHCTPLLGHKGEIGVWMVLLIDAENSDLRRKFRAPPAVATSVTPSHHGAASPSPDIRRRPSDASSTRPSLRGVAIDTAAAQQRLATGGSPRTPIYQQPNSNVNSTPRGLKGDGYANGPSSPLRDPRSKQNVTFLDAGLGSRPASRGSDRRASSGVNFSFDHPFRNL